MENKKPKVITGKIMVRWITIFAFIVYATCWIILSIREGQIIPDFVRENWWQATLFILLPFVNLFIPKEKNKDSNVKNPRQEINS